MRWGGANYHTYGFFHFSKKSRVASLKSSEGRNTSLKKNPESYSYFSHPNKPISPQTPRFTCTRAYRRWMSIHTLLYSLFFTTTTPTPKRGYCAPRHRAVSRRFSSFMAENTRARVPAFTTRPKNTRNPQAAAPPPLRQPAPRHTPSPQPSGPRPLHTPPHRPRGHPPERVALAPGAAPPPPLPVPREQQRESRWFCPYPAEEARSPPTAMCAPTAPLHKGMRLPRTARRTPPAAPAGSGDTPCPPPSSSAGGGTPHLPAPPYPAAPASAGAGRPAEGARRTRAIPPSRGRAPPPPPPAPQAWSSSAAEPECARRPPLPGFSPPGAVVVVEEAEEGGVRGGGRARNEAGAINRRAAAATASPL